MTPVGLIMFFPTLFLCVCARARVCVNGDNFTAKLTFLIYAKSPQIPLSNLASPEEGYTIKS